MSEYYGISGKEEAIEYFNNPILKNRNLECRKVLVDSKNDNPFGEQHKVCVRRLMVRGIGFSFEGQPSKEKTTKKSASVLS